MKTLVFVCDRCLLLLLFYLLVDVVPLSVLEPINVSFRFLSLPYDDALEKANPPGRWVANDSRM